MKEVLKKYGWKAKFETEEEAISSYGGIKHMENTREEAVKDMEKYIKELIDGGYEMESLEIFEKDLITRS